MKERIASMKRMQTQSTRHRAGQYMEAVYKEIRRRNAKAKNRAKNRVARKSRRIARRHRR